MVFATCIQVLYAGKFYIRGGSNHYRLIYLLLDIYSNIPLFAKNQHWIRRFLVTQDLPPVMYLQLTDKSRGTCTVSDLGV